MKPLLNSTQRYAVVVAVLVVFSIFVGITTDGDLGVIDRQFGALVDAMSALLMGTVPELLSGAWSFLHEVPLVVLTLAAGAIYFTFRFDFINLRGVKHAVEVLSGKYADPDDPGEVSHFQALSTALSATVGLGNIAGVAIAVALGGPGAVFWMMTAAVFGMASKFAECTLGQMYRKVDEEGRVQGGPMVYLRDGLAEIGRPTLGKYLAVIFAILCIGASFGAGNMFQANQSFQASTELVPWLAGDKAQGEATIVHDNRIEFTNYPSHLVRLNASSADGEELEKLLDERGDEPTETTLHELARDEGHDNLVYFPRSALDVDLEDWTRTDDDRWQLTIPVEAADPGPDHDIDPGRLQIAEFGEVDNRDVDWTIFAEMTIDNEEAVAGGVQHRGWLFGILMVFLVGLVIVGGIKRIGKVAASIVPFMCLVYVLAALYILLSHYHLVPQAAMTMVAEAFNPEAGMGGLVGVLIVGIQRAVFSSEAGIGSAAIAHSAARTKEPVREGLVALLEPGIDTIIVCFMTGAVIVITGVYADPATAGLDDIALTQAAFGTVIGWFPYILAVAVVLFAFSTMISWSYYGERCWSYLFGARDSMTYRILFLFFIFLGSISTLDNVLEFADMMLLSMAFPNILGVVLLSPKIKSALESYWDRLQSGEFDDA